MSHKHHKKHNQHMRVLANYARVTAIAVVAFFCSWFFIHGLQMWMAALSSGADRIQG